jgi:large subunit ribosomal protein L6
MLSFLLPKNVIISCSSDLIKIQYNEDVVIKKIGLVRFNRISSSEGNRLFASGLSASSALSIIYDIVFGLTRGYQKRLRLVGIGFRAIIKPAEEIDKLQTKNYRRKRTISNVYGKLISIKIGYSHESIYPIINITKTQYTVSALEGRTKGILIDIVSNNKVEISQAAAELRSFRCPDVYKGKGIFYKNEVVTLKKGKRQG